MKFQLRRGLLVQREWRLCMHTLPHLHTQTHQNIRERKEKKKQHMHVATSSPHPKPPPFIFLSLDTHSHVIHRHGTWSVHASISFSWRAGAYYYYYQKLMLPFGFLIHSGAESCILLATALLSSECNAGCPCPLEGCSLWLCREATLWLVRERGLLHHQETRPRTAWPFYRQGWDFQWWWGQPFLLSPLWNLPKFLLK